MGERLRRHQNLVVVCTAAAVVEALLVNAFAPTSSLGLATQITAPPPFGVFHDLRWIVVYHESWFGLGGRAPRVPRVPEPADRGLSARRVAARPRARAVGGDDSAQRVVHRHRRGVARALGRADVRPRGRVVVVALLRRDPGRAHARPPRARRRGDGVVVASHALRSQSRLGPRRVRRRLSVFGSIMTTCPAWARVPVAALAGVANAWLWLHVVDAVLHRRRVPRAFPVAPVGIAGVLVLVVGGTAAGFALAKTPVLHFVSPAEAATQWNPSATPADGTPLVVVTGFNTKWDGRADQYVRVDLPQWRFSYRGTSGGAPLPYTADDTHRALPDLVRALRDQVSTYHRATGRRLTLVAESEGALLAKAYLAASPGAPVREPRDPEPARRAGPRLLPVGGRRGVGRRRCRRHGGVRVGARWRVAGRRHAGHAVSPLDRRRRARAARADGVLAPARPPTRGAAPRHRGERARAEPVGHPVHRGARVPRRDARRRHHRVGGGA